MQIIKLFSRQGHTGFTANYAVNMLNKLLRYVPLSPLTGEDDEWTKIDFGVDMEYQNKRCPSVFKGKDGKAYNAEGKVFSNDGGNSWYTCKDSKVYITFPYDVPTSPERILLENTSEQ